MNINQLIALAPIITIAGTAVAVMLSIAVRRNFILCLRHCRRRNHLVAAVTGHRIAGKSGSGNSIDSGGCLLAVLYGAVAVGRSCGAGVLLRLFQRS